MFTADDARRHNFDDLDARIKAAVKDAGSATCAYMRVYNDDGFLPYLKEELEKRGFHSVDVPDIVIKGDVYFCW